MKKLTIEEMKEIAKSRGGECLSGEYINNQTKLFWKCKEGHIWETIPNNIKQGKWCPYCAGIIKLTLEEMKNLAKEKDGICLSDKYINARTKLRWKCKKGHVWEAIPYTVKKGMWCPVCGHIKNGLKKRLTIEEMKLLAEEKGGECLSEEYRNAFTLLEWKCKCGYIWKASPNNIKRGTWCPRCSGHESMSIKDIRKLAKRKGGKCLSVKYFGVDIKLKWKCGKCNYIWEATPFHIKTGCWCPRCAGNLKKSIEEMKKLAKSHNGKCLSSKYFGVYTNLIWQCDKGHTWKATPTNVIRGTWCPICAKYEYKSEKKCRKIFEELFNSGFPTIKPLWLINDKTGKRLELDGYNKKLKIAFEHQGLQHYGKYKRFFKSKEDYKKLLYRDYLKKKLCKERGIKLIVIPQLNIKIKGKIFITDKNLKKFILSHFTKSELKRIYEL